MDEDLSEKLAEALATDVELHGGDAMLALQVSQMTDEQKAQSRRNVDASIERLRRLAGMTGSRGPDDV